MLASLLFAATFAAFGAILGRRASTEDVVISSVNDYRRRVEGLDGVVGSFSNPSLLRLSLAGEPSSTRRASK